MGLFNKIDNHLVITSFLLLFSLGIVICRARPARLLDDVYDLVGGDHDEDFHKRQTRRQVGLLELDESDDSEDDDNTRGAVDTDKKEVGGRNAPATGQKEEVPMYTDAIPFRRRVSRGKTVVGAHSGEYNDEPLKLENRGAMASEKGDGSPTRGTGGAPAGAKEEGTVKELGDGKPGSTVHDDDIVSIRESPAHAASKSKPIPAPAKGSVASQKNAAVKSSPAKALPSPAQKSPSKTTGVSPAHGAEVAKLEASLDHGKGQKQLVGKSPAVVGKPVAVNGAAEVAKPAAVPEPVKSKGQEQLVGQSPAVVGKPKDSGHGADLPKPVAVQPIKAPEQIVGESPAVIGKVDGSKPASIWTGTPSGQGQGHEQLVGISPAVLEISKNSHSTIEVLKPVSSDIGKAQEQLVAESPAVAGKPKGGSIWKTVSEKDELEPVAADTVKHVDVREPVAESHPQAEMPEEKGVPEDKEPAGQEEVKHVDVRAQGAPEHVLVEVEKPIADVAVAVKAPEPAPVEEAKHVDARQPAPVDHAPEGDKEKEVVAVKEPEPVPEAKHVDVRQPNIPDHAHLEGEKEEHLAAIKEPEPESKHVHVRQNEAILHDHVESEKKVHKQKRSIPDEQEPGKSNENDLDSNFHPRRKFGKRSIRGRNVRKTHSHSRSKKQVHRI